MSDKINFRLECYRDKEGHYTMIKGSIHQEDIILAYIYASNIGAPKYMNQVLTDLKGDRDSNTVKVGGFNNG